MVKAKIEKKNVACYYFIKYTEVILESVSDLYFKNLIECMSRLDCFAVMSLSFYWISFASVDRSISFFVLFFYFISFYF